DSASTPHSSMQQFSIEIAAATAAPVISSFVATPSSISSGQSSVLSWSVSGNPAPTLSLDNGIGAVTGSSRSISPSATATYTLTAANSLGSANATATVTVAPSSGGGTSSGGAS